MILLSLLHRLSCLHFTQQLLNSATSNSSNLIMAKEAIPEGMDIAQFFSLLSPQQQRQFYQGPAMTPPDGVVPNFDNPPNKDTMGYGVIIASAVLSTLAVAARLYSRLFVGKMASLRLEDCKASQTVYTKSR